MAILTYKGYIATIEHDERENIDWGKVLGMTDRITFEGETCSQSSPSSRHLRASLSAFEPAPTSHDGLLRCR